MTFAAFAIQHGLIVDQVYPSERIHRCPTDAHPRSKNGAYLFTGERGWIMDWSTGQPIQFWNDKNAVGWSDADKRAWAAKKHEADIKREGGYRKAAKTALELIKRCQPDEHAYLKGKQLPDVLGLVTEDRELVVPMRNLVNNELVGVQVIKWLMDERKWEKKMLFGMRAKAAVFRLGSAKAPETWLCEGYVTGLTIERALRRLSLNASVLVCFSANNMIHVAPQIHGRKFVFADNDASGTGESAAKATDAPYAMSSIVGEDANDWYARAGILAVCKAILEVRNE